MKIFVFEFVTGGGFAGQPLPDFLADGEAMWSALVNDLTEIDGVEVLTLRDRRLAFPAGRGNLAVLPMNEGFLESDFQRCLAAADAAWIVAPEEAGCLEAFSRKVIQAGKRLLGCRPEAVRLAASKYATARQLRAAGLPALRTYTSPFQMTRQGRVVAKPDDGAGCHDTYFFENLSAARDWSRSRNISSFVFQYFMPGEALSLSLLCNGVNAKLLSVNRQHIALSDGRLHFRQVTAAAVPDKSDTYANLARRVVAAVPGLWGYVGIDLIAAASGPKLVEINPRLTAAYAGLRKALHRNLAQEVLSLSLIPQRTRTARSPAPDKLATT